MSDCRHMWLTPTDDGGFCCANCKLTLVTTDTLRARCERLEKALEKTAMGDDRDDKRPCWCGSPTLARYRRAKGEPNDGHSPLCVECRAALSNQPETPKPGSEG